MEATRPAAAAWQITGARHAGITVSDLDRSLEFYCGLLGLELLWRRLCEERGPEIVGVPEATALDIAMLRIPGSDVEVELLEYRGLEQIRAHASVAPRHGSLLRLRRRHRPALRRSVREGRPLPLGRRGRTDRAEQGREEPLLARS